MESPTTEDRTHSPEPKRRKIRKGTRSCWECKRRKVRCSFVSASDEVCAPCRRRASVCVSQELPEELAHGHTKREQTERIERMEALLKQLGVDPGPDYHKLPKSRPIQATHGTVEVGRQQESPQHLADTNALPTPSLSDSTSPSGRYLPDVFPLVPSHDASSARALGIRVDLSDSVQWNNPYTEKLCKLSQALRAAFPVPEDVQIICHAYKGATIYIHQILTRTHESLELEGPTEIAHLVNIPGPQTHPVLMAKWMLLFALFLQQSFPLEVTNLTEDPKVVVARLKDTATCLITTNEELFGTTESLECILLEAAYEKNHGNFRRAWLAVRRGMTAAQLMNLHRPQKTPTATLDPNNTTCPRYLFFRIIYMDRFLCLMLGLPAVSLDIDLSIPKEAETPLGLLERTHTMVSKSILERNEADTDVDYSVTERIDAELLAASEKLPPQFWQPLDFENYRSHDQRIFWETLRLANQVNHFNLLNHLHLPYLLSDDSRYASSKITCAHASREVLTRWMAFRRHNALYVCCRIGDFFALRAALTLCLAHLANHHNAKPLLSLRHQRLGDRSIVEQTLGVLEQLSTQVDDPLARESADLLRRLLLVEADAAQGQVYNTRKCIREEGTYAQDGSVFSIYIPYFGILKISPGGTFSKEGGDEGWPLSSMRPGKPRPVTHIGMLPTENEPSFMGTSQLAPKPAEFAFTPPADPVGTSAQQQPSADPELSALDLPNEQFIPFPIAGVDDWAFQGVDTAFFDSLMRGMTGPLGFSQSDESSEVFNGQTHA